jgi:hypothetical protein
MPVNLMSLVSVRHSPPDCSLATCATIAPLSTRTANLVQYGIENFGDVPGASFEWTISRQSVPGEVSTFPILLLQALAWDECQLQ